MKKLKKIILALAVLVLLPLSGCDPITPEESCKKLANADELIATPITDSFKFAQESLYQNSNFTIPKANGLMIGEASVKSHTDGDTVNFSVEDYEETVRLRFLGISTPESTAKIEPWGQKASLFVKRILEEAETIVLINDTTTFGERDSSGNRHLGYIWYRASASSDFRLLNLEIVEQCFSKNFLFVDSDLLPYRPLFEQAAERGEKCGYRVFGTKDPDYDYSGEVAAITIREIRDNYEDYGVSEGGSSGKQLRISGLVVGQMGDSMVLRDITDADEDTGEYASMYAYAGYNTSLASFIAVGDIIMIYARATMFSGNIQLSDLKTNTTGKQKIEWLAFGTNSQFWTEDEPDPRLSNYPSDISPYLMDTSSFKTYEDFAPYSGYVVKTNVTIRYVTPFTDDEDDDVSGEGDEYYYKKDSNKNMTVYGKSDGLTTDNRPLYMNLRVSGEVYPYPDYGLFEPGHTYEVIGYLAKYFDRYQVQLFNNIPGNDYIVPLT